jgi:DNA-binding response OmpR family regulator
MTFRVLVVDDYPGAADIACVLVRMLGCIAESAHTARETLAAVETFDPDIIVLDLGLPDGSGYEVARQIRSRDGKQPFIAAMTGREETSQGLDAGIDMHVVKPASAENLGYIIDAARKKLRST